MHDSSPRTELPQRSVRTAAPRLQPAVRWLVKAFLNGALITTGGRQEEPRPDIIGQFSCYTRRREP